MVLPVEIAVTLLPRLSCVYSVNTADLEGILSGGLRSLEPGPSVLAHTRGEML